MPSQRPQMIRSATAPDYLTLESQQIFDENLGYTFQNGKLVNVVGEEVKVEWYATLFLRKSNGDVVDALGNNRKWKQDRVEETVKEVIHTMTDEEIDNVKVSKLLSQSILFQGNEQGFIDEYKKISAQMAGEIPDPVKLQNEAVLKYLQWWYEWWNPLADIKDTANFFTKSIGMYVVPHFRDLLDNGETLLDQSIQFAVIRHGEKLQKNKRNRVKGQLSESWIVQAQEAWEALKWQSLDGVFGVQQPHNQMLMLALTAWKYWCEDTAEAWEKLPEAWQSPYQTGEITTYDISYTGNLANYATHEESSSENISEMDISEKAKDELFVKEKSSFLKQRLRIMITRNGHSEEFMLSDMQKYLKEDFSI